MSNAIISTPREISQALKVEKPIAHHNASFIYKPTSNHSLKENEKPYGVQPLSRIITRGQFLRRYDDILNYLRRLGLGDRESWVAIRLMQFFVYYGQVYPKAKTVCGGEEVLDSDTMKVRTIGAYCSVRTFWYAVEKLEELGLLEVVNTFLDGYQTSNHYILDALVLYIVSLLAEHGQMVLAPYQVQMIIFFKELWHENQKFKVRLSQPSPFIALN